MCKSLSDNAFDRGVKPIPIVEARCCPIRVAKIELGKVAMKVMLLAVLIHAAHPALEDGEAAFNRVRVDGRVRRIDVDSLHVRRRLMGSEMLVHETILSRSDEHTSELQSLLRLSSAVF